MAFAIPALPDIPKKDGAGRRQLRLTIPWTCGPIALKFSAGGPSKTAERWRVFIDRDGSADDGARALVRAIQSRDKLPQLVESLRAHKPLVEWPERSAAAGASAGASAGAARGGAARGGRRRHRRRHRPRPTRPARHASRCGSVSRRGAGAGARAPRLPPWPPLAAMLSGGILVGVLGTWLAFRDPQPIPRDTSPTTLAALAAAELERSVGAVREACQVKADSTPRRATCCAPPSRAARCRRFRPGIVQTTPLPKPDLRPD